MWYRIRRIINWINLSTPAGLLIARIGGAHTRKGEFGLVYAHDYRIPFPIANAFTVGNVVLTKYPDGFLQGRLLAHESRHASQYAACIGLPMLILYPLSLVISVAVCGDIASWNLFERLANLEDGGYRRHPPRWRRTSPH
ncbi:hypothetical protein GCM10009555_067880 [Acrocarpospora macrocephala]|uniref:DUF4157 domain-containing protein n=1 Tax=Acrocarpospora macrocephala TaxID=150177 RepID=A0A5M3WYL2_9ACTN|nr:hypothetical protein [Acrocarpospora macrocephala]GES14585.1 hypothetical protein Amac_081820 [Acrocarpospora macrocephala]